MSCPCIPHKAYVENLRTTRVKAKFKGRNLSVPHHVFRPHPEGHKVPLLNRSIHGASGTGFQVPVNPAD